MDAAASLNLTVGLLQLVLGLVVLAYLGRFGRTFPWLAALMVFSLARGADRVYVAATGDQHTAASLATDGLVVLTLVLMTVGLRATIGGLQKAHDDASGKTAEYERALLDYRTLMRHRTANRINAIRGAVQTLAANDLDRKTRDDLVAMLDAETARLEEDVLSERLYSPRPRGPEEQHLRPRPRRRFRRAAEPDEAPAAPGRLAG